MHHFIIELTYTVSWAELQATLPEHRTFLNVGYENGWVLVSGPQVSHKGGVIIVRAPSLDDLKAYFAEDPLRKKGLAVYRYIEFDPVRRQAFMDDWSSKP